MTRVKGAPMYQVGDITVMEENGRDVEYLVENVSESAANPGVWRVKFRRIEKPRVYYRSLLTGVVYEWNGKDHSSLLDRTQFERVNVTVAED